MLGTLSFGRLCKPKEGESVIALPFPISTTISIISGIPASTLRLVGNDEIGLRALSVLRGAQGDIAAGIV